MKFDNFKGFDLPKIQTKTWRNPIVLIFEDGSRRVSETTITSYDDWWDTPLGRINFGRAYMHARHFIERPAPEQDSDSGGKT